MADGSADRETGALTGPALVSGAPLAVAADAGVVPASDGVISPARPQPAVTGRGPATLRDVASVVGVSPSAVSMALADHPRIGRATKEAVRAAARELGYVANSAGRALQAGRAASIAVIIPNTAQHVFGHPYFMHLLVGVTSAANAHDSAVLISTNPATDHDPAAYDRILRSQAAAGAIIASAAINDPNVARLVGNHLPVVLIGRYPHLPQAVSVGMDDIAGAAAATRHLITEHGVRRIGHISGPLEHQTALDRYQGFRNAVAESPEPCSQALAVGDFSEDAGRAGAAQLLDAMPGMEAIFAANDEMAYGALLEVTARGMRVPHDIALVGYDDFGISRLTTPAITTVRVPAEELGRQAAELLFGLIDGRSEPATHDVVPIELVTRQSCGQHAGPLATPVLPD